MTMHVAVCIVSFRNPEDVNRCLKALEHSSYSDFEVVICENGGAAAFAELYAATPKRLQGGQTVRVVLAPSNLGYAGGVNLCLATSPDADAWWVLNPDTQPDPNALASQVERLTAGDCDAVGVTVYLAADRVQSHGGRWSSWLARAESLGHGTARDEAPNPATIEREQNYLNGASMTVSRRFLDAVGPMREDYFLYCEEVEWFLRGVGKGMRLGFAPGAGVFHDAGTTTGSYEAITKRPRTPVYLNERNKILTTRDCFPSRLPIAA
ncbi:MAG: glycosyltransferase family 2 protein, partial [Alphaproteobacteria bacterium]